MVSCSKYRIYSLLKFSGVHRSSVFTLQSYKQLWDLFLNEWCATNDAKECERPTGGSASFTRRSCQTVLEAHLLSIGRIMAPILPYLAERLNKMCEPRNEADALHHIFITSQCSRYVVAKIT
ncbi:hypothetical protein H5410_004113 [Solanum commersonii]|uniref:Uncharacterized protein n=1 Tax=Solanum commersonii TaxID=4109 RepID=A0A9J6B764_SOLCO|nr:hypothetical protein H5410_004113 [Solanum commersonii]